MNQVRAITILFTGSELSPVTIKKIYEVIRRDDNSNVQNVSIDTYNPSEVATMVTSTAIAISNAKPDSTSALEIAINLLHRHYGETCERVKTVPVFRMASDYFTNAEVRSIFNEINSVSDSELSCYKPYLDSKISRQFINAIRSIVNSANDVSR